MKSFLLVMGAMLMMATSLSAQTQTEQDAHDTAETTSEALDVIVAYSDAEEAAADTQYTNSVSARVGCTNEFQRDIGDAYVATGDAYVDTADDFAADGSLDATSGGVHFSAATTYWEDQFFASAASSYQLATNSMNYAIDHYDDAYVDYGNAKSCYLSAIAAYEEGSPPGPPRTTE